MDDDRLINIESKLAHQEHLVAALNDALTSQQAQLTKLETLCQSLLDRLKDAGAGNGDSPADEKPPHY